MCCATWPRKKKSKTIFVDHKILWVANPIITHKCLLVNFYRLNYVLWCAYSLSHVQLFVTSCTVACQSPLSMKFSRPECWSGLPCPPPGDLPNPGIKPVVLRSCALAGGFFTTSTTGEALSEFNQVFGQGIIH